MSLDGYISFYSPPDQMKLSRFNEQTFLGQKYGYRPFPAKIPASEFEKLLGAVDNKDDHQLLKKWFWRDDNAVPAQYLLQPITSLLPHYRNYENNELRKKASADWWAASCFEVGCWQGFRREERAAQVLYVRFVFVLLIAFSLMVTCDLPWDIPLS